MSRLREDTIQKRQRIAAWHNGDETITTGELHKLVHAVAENQESLRRLQEGGRPSGYGSPFQAPRSQPADGLLAMRPRRFRRLRYG